jgi:UDP-2-acetamido-3-amino-2,3-dideoxy-glucuronate N-acetyltransferase
MSFFAHETAVIDADCIIGEGTRIWHFSHLMTGAQIGKDCTIGQNVMIAAGVVVGDHVKVQNNVSLYSGLICEDYVFIGPSAVFTNVLNPRSAISRKTAFKQTIIRRGATIGANATIICGIEIGAYVMVGAGSVITKMIKPYSLMVGNPARQIGWVSEYGHTLQFNDGMATCPESRQEYVLENDQVTRIK